MKMKQRPNRGAISIINIPCRCGGTAKLQEWIEPDFLAILRDIAKYSARMGITKLAYTQSGQQERVGNLLSMNGNVEWQKKGNSGK